MKLKKKIPSKSHRKGVDWEEDAKEAEQAEWPQITDKPNISAITANTKEPDS